MDQTEKRPPPPVPADADLRRFNYMPLDVVQLFNSDTWNMSSGWEAKAAMNLWMRAWHQVPAGSLPNNDSILRNFAAVPDWESVRAIALRGYCECSDGRLYHRILCDKVLDVLGRSSKAKTSANSRWHNGKRRNASAMLINRKGIDIEKDSKEESSPAVGDDWPPDYADQFWSRYPPGRKYGKAKVIAKLMRVRRDGVTWATLMAGLDKFLATRPTPKYTPAPMVWLNDQRWDADYGTERTAHGQVADTELGRGEGFAALAVRLRARQGML